MLFPDQPTPNTKRRRSARALPVESTAVFSSDRVYRYSLTRRWSQGPRVLFVMLNPSTATEFSDDPTIRRVVDFATRWGFGEVQVVNLYAFRATRPAELRACADPVGPENDDHIALALPRAVQVVAAWGANVGPQPERRDQVVEMLDRSNVYCLGLSRRLEPRHPLFVRADTARRLFPSAPEHKR